jgi:hypothetical protein
MSFNKASQIAKVVSYFINHIYINLLSFKNANYKQQNIYKNANYKQQNSIENAI